MTRASEPLINIEGLTKIFYTDEIETHALSGVYLSISKGEYVAMSGPFGMREIHVALDHWPARYADRRKIIAKRQIR